ncbi:MAG: hypothetical protein AMXMBFR84_23830 [Candidatus Hydrogenedentota bacterium]
MAQIVLEQPGVAPITVKVAEKPVHLGRADDNDVVLVADEVSRHHAKLAMRGEQFVLVDLNSLNGTYVNRQRIVERVLADKDEIWFGSKCRAFFSAEPVAPGAVAVDRISDLAKPLVARPTDIVKRKAAAPQAPAVHLDSSQIHGTVVQDLDRIREDLERVGNSMTLIGKMGQTPQPVGRSADSGFSQDDLLKMSKAYRRLEALYRATKLIASDFDLPKRLAAVLDTAIEVMDAERGFLMLRDEGTEEVRVHVARKMGQDLKAAGPSMGIAGRAILDGEPVLMRDRESDDRFSGRESIIMQQIRSAMAVPLKIEERVFGSIYVDSRNPTHTFTEEDLELFASFAAQSSMAIENVRLYERMVEAEKTRANLGRFLSPSIVEAVMTEHASLELGGRKRVVTTMFTDIRGFTSITETLTPEQLIAMLNEHFTASTDIIFRYEGTLDKYIGDAVMAVFGSPFERPDDPLRAVRTALEMMERNRELNIIRAQEGRPVIEMGIGIDTGEVNAGLMGSPERLEFTVVGDSVNTASRLCSKAEAGQILIGERTYSIVKDAIVAAEMGAMMLKGKAAEVKVFQLEGLA